MKLISDKTKHDINTEITNQMIKNISSRANKPTMLKTETEI